MKHISEIIPEAIKNKTMEDELFIKKHLDRIKGIQQHGIKISINWDCSKSFQWMLDHAKFIFSYKHGGERIKIVVDEKIEERYDCFEIGNDRYGIQVKACTCFGSGWGNMILDSSKEIIPFIKDYLERSGATDLFQRD